MEEERRREGVRWLGHDADLRLAVRAVSRERLFVLAAEAVARSMIDGDPPEESDRRTIRLEADDAEALLVSWLNEVIYLVTGGVFFPATVRSLEIRGCSLVAEHAGVSRGPCFPPLAREVKAATFHGLRIAEGNGTWRGTILFDV
ncbi:MAG: archease [Candidatus Eisenbacteria bacterium]